MNASPFCDDTRRDLEAEAFHVVEQVGQHVRDLLFAVRQLGGLDVARAVRLLRAQRNSPEAAAQLAAVAWPTLQAHATLMKALERLVRLAGYRPNLLPSTARDDIAMLRQNGDLDVAHASRLLELNTLRNDLAHDQATMDPQALHRAIELVLTEAAPARLKETFRELFAQAGVQL